MWRAIKHKQLKDSYEINKDTMEIRSKVYSILKNGESLDCGSRVISKEWEGNNVVYLFHAQRRDWFRVDRLYKKTFATEL